MPDKCIQCFETSKAKIKKDQGFLIWKYVCWVELCPQKRNAEVLTSVPMTMTLFTVFPDVSMLKWGLLGGF